MTGRREMKLWALSGAIVASVCGGFGGLQQASADSVVLTVENGYLELAIDDKGRCVRFVDKATGTNHVDAGDSAAFASIRLADSGKEIDATSATAEGSVLRLRFGDHPAEARLRIRHERRYLLIDVVGIEGKNVERLTFGRVSLTVAGELDDPFQACALALNLQTTLRAVPQPMSEPHAMCYERYGIVGAKMALIGCPRGRLRDVIQEAVSATAEIPTSVRGGPWSLDVDANRESYMFNFGNLTEETVDDWIEVAQALGITQIDFHGGRSFRFGDCQPNPVMYPRGFDSLKAVIDKLHEAGIAAGLHTYAYFIANDSPWVTPVPDPRLMKNGEYTLAESISAEDTVAVVRESTEDRSLDVGWATRDSTTIQIDNELIVYSGLSKEPPYAFTKCQRGAYGTKAVAHEAGTTVYNMAKCWNLFAPDPESTLFNEVAHATADAYNRCGFDMIYLDALDGETLFAPWEYSWHYASRFTFELVNRLEKPPILEMSVFHHHLWYVRSRFGAWDHPMRSHRAFIDMHARWNDKLSRCMMPMHMGWWAVKTWGGPQHEPTFAEDIEYLLGKGLAYDSGFSIMHLDPETYASTPVYRRYAEIMRQYEALRYADAFDDQTKARLREPDKPFTLERAPDGEWQLLEARYPRHKVRGLDGVSDSWTVVNAFESQPLRLRIEALLSAQPYAHPDAITLADFESDGAFTEFDTAEGVTHTLRATGKPAETGGFVGRLEATNGGQVEPTAAWTKAARLFDPPANLKAERALGVWAKGDRSGALLNLQLRSPEHIKRGISDHYIDLDFDGWRYFELIETEAERWLDYVWPYQGGFDAKAIFRHVIDPRNISELGLWLNNLPADRKVTCALRPVRALPLVEAEIVNPTIRVNGQKLAFPVTLRSGQYLELRGPKACVVYGKQGERVAELTLADEIPTLASGENLLRFTCEGPVDVNPRAYVTTFIHGEVIGTAGDR